MVGKTKIWDVNTVFEPIREKMILPEALSITSSNEPSHLPWVS
jgi:hypothetical protein